VFDISDPSMIPVLELKMTGPDMTEDDDSTEANIYLAVCKIRFFIDFQLFLPLPR
jgi:hypothetical protein